MSGYASDNSDGSLAFPNNEVSEASVTYGMLEGVSGAPTRGDFLFKSFLWGYN